MAEIFIFLEILGTGPRMTLFETHGCHLRAGGDPGKPEGRRVVTGVIFQSLEILVTSPRMTKVKYESARWQGWKGVGW